MRKSNKLLLVFLLGMRAVFAEPVSLDFKGATVVDVVQTVVREIMKKDYVIAPEVLSSERRISVNIKKAETEKLGAILDGILKTVQVQMVERGGVYYIEKEAVTDTPIQPLARPVAASSIPDQAQVSPLTQKGLPEANKVPDFIENYRPKGRSIEFLSAVAKAAGANVLELKGKTDSLVFSGTKEAMEKARAILHEVDTAPVSVSVRAVLVEFTDGKTDSKSISIALNLLAGKIGAVYQAGSLLANALTYKGGNLNAALSMIEGDSRFKYVAEPTLRVMDGETAKLTVGTEVPTRGAITKDNQGNAQQSIEYRTAGVVINLEPRVLDGMVTLKIGQQISSFSLTTTSNIDSPTILKRESQTTVAVRPGELVMLAGMDEDRSSKSASGLSFLPRWAHSSNEESSRSQLVLLLEVLPEEKTSI